VIAVTGAAGFIGSNIVRGLNARGRDDIIVVDDLTDGRKFTNLVDCRFVDYVDKDAFRARVAARNGALRRIEVIFHQGACADTTEWNGRFMLDANYTCSCELLEYCLDTGTRLIYASSAAVYGTCRRFEERDENERPVNVYGYSKKLFDDAVRRRLASCRTQVAGLRYFNVYGPGEWHKGAMASVAYHLHGQLRTNGIARLFRGSGGYTDGEQRRDFIHVDDVVAVNLWFLDHAQASGIFNVGTGASRSFNDVAAQLIAVCGAGRIAYIDMPAHLRAAYQHFTEASLDALRGAGYTAPFRSLEQGLRAYAAVLDQAHGGV
jgi:ADP-L-glycero-D-manno-heptose 6-epimerase